jgi:hypothetical protein
MILIGLAGATLGFAAEVIPVLSVDGTRYESVKFGPVNGDRVILFHSRGVTSVALQSLPAEYRPTTAVISPALPTNDLLPIPAEVDGPATPAAAPAPERSSAPDPAAILEAMRAQRSSHDSSPTSRSQGTGDWAVYNRERMLKVVLDGRLVDKATLTPLVGFLVKGRTKLTENGRDYYGAALDIAQRKATADQVATGMDLRPALWTRTDERVFLLDYKPVTLPGAVLRVYTLEVKAVDGWRTFKVGTEPSFDEWKRLSGRW